MILPLVLAQGGIDATPIIVAIVAALGGSGLTAAMTLRATARKLDAESERIYQEALKLADERATANVETMDRIARTLGERLSVTEEALGIARQKLDEAEEHIRDLTSRADLLQREKELAVIEAQAERDRLRRRIVELEERVADLIAALPGRRRRDPHPPPPIPPMPPDDS